MDYERGLAELKRRLEAEHSDRLVEFSTLEARLRENLAADQRFGSSETVRAERARIIGELNRLSLDTIGISFNDLCSKPVLKPPQPQPLTPNRSEPALSPQPSPPRHPARTAKAMLALLVVDLVLALVLAWRLFGARSDVLTYVQAVTGLLGLVLQIVLVFVAFRVREMSIPDVINALATRRWLQASIVLMTLMLSGLAVLPSPDESRLSQDSATITPSASRPAISPTWTLILVQGPAPPAILHSGATITLTRGENVQLSLGTAVGIPLSSNSAKCKWETLTGQIENPDDCVSVVYQASSKSTGDRDSISVDLTEGTTSHLSLQIIVLP
jgi:hypothetical protein